ncbi:transketolase [Cohaesibacter celericrescens]|uniref:Transketolase n=1 Tax=Cohaesibacter celericrescens TaxID=2067669 RepID=A0A2N5XU61_9HYPH|nr:transketolase [Cohaesibacter celericrescens]PLW77985.1 transketolase [Cohaesibacter celericrescens]
MDISELEQKAREVRKRIIRMNSAAGQGHTGGDLSETDILVALYFRILRQIDPTRTNPDRDRFILSKGHGVGGYYCTLAEAGYLEDEDLTTYLGFETRCPGHPVRQKTPCIELNTGALGHGVPVSVGMALSAKRQQKDFRVYVLTGDGELQEGSNWEAALSAQQYCLDNLVVIVDRNRLQLADRTENIIGLEPLADKWRAFGFDVQETQGNDMGSVVSTLEGLDFTCGCPHVVIANTTKGAGISFIEDRPAWHHRVPKGDEVALAIAELEA